MYDINRSNLLSTETLKLYLYDIMLLDMFNRRIETHYESLELAKRQIKMSANFDATPYRQKSETIFELTKYIFYACICFIGIIMLVFLTYDISNLFNFQIDLHIIPAVIYAIFLLSAALAFIPFLFKWQRIQKENLLLTREEETALQKFEENEIYRLDNEKKLLSKINIQINHLNEKSNYINQWLNQLYDFDILQTHFHDSRSCSYIFQLFDTNQVKNLSEAESLYEALCSNEDTDTLVMANETDIVTDSEHLEYLYRCVSDNTEEIQHILEGMSMNGQYIASNIEAIEINSEIININTNTLLLLQELGLLV